MKKAKDSRQFVVIGLGQFGLNMARGLHRMGYEVLAVDTRIERVQEYSNEFTHVVQADATDENALRELGILNFDVVVVAIGRRKTRALYGAMNAHMVDTLICNEELANELLMLYYR